MTDVHIDPTRGAAQSGPGRALCPECGRRIALYPVGGRLRHHGGGYPHRRGCSGSCRLPVPGAPR